MAENKKSFILYVDLIHTVKHLTDEQAGRLFKHVLSYCNDESPKTDDVIINLTFEPIKLQLKRDLKKWEKQQEQRALAGRKSAEVRKRNATTVNERSISSTDNVTVNVNDTNTNVLDVKKIDSYLSEMKSQSQFLEGLYVTYKFKPLTIGKVGLLFKEHLKMFPKEHNTFIDFRNHFKSWIGHKVNRGELGEYLKHQKGEL